MIGKLKLLEDQNIKSFQSFEPDLDNTVKEFQKEKALTKFAGKTDKTIKNLDGDFTRKRRIELVSQQIVKLRQEGRS